MKSSYYTKTLISPILDLWFTSIATGQLRIPDQKHHQRQLG
jgi:hypothetical protein